MKFRRKYRSINKRIIRKRNNYFVKVVIIMIIIGFVFIILGINARRNVTPLYSYEVKKEANYEVLLKPNNFYTTETLPAGSYYASKSIKSFNINYKYNLKSYEPKDMDYRYTITANLIGKANTSDNLNKEVWSRSFDLNSGNKKNIKDTEEFSINEYINIDYEYYNNLARSYEKAYEIKIDTTLKIYLNVYIDLKIPNLQQIEDSIELDIPINNTITEVKENFENINYNNVYPENKTFGAKEIIFYIIGILFILGGITILIWYIVKNKKERSPEDIYEDNINKILNFYRGIIVTVSNKPDVSNLEVMNITILDDLIDVAEQCKRNIIHYKELGKSKSNLYVIIDKYVYIYIVTTNELK